MRSSGRAARSVWLRAVRLCLARLVDHEFEEWRLRIVVHRAQRLYPRVRNRCASARRRITVSPADHLKADTWGAFPTVRFGAFRRQLLSGSDILGSRSERPALVGFPWKRAPDRGTFPPFACELSNGGLYQKPTFNVRSRYHPMSGRGPVGSTCRYGEYPFSAGRECKGIHAHPVEADTREAAMESDRGIICTDGVSWRIGRACRRP